MKKNLRIVSVAAALLAVAPVAAGVVPAASVNTVQAAENSSVNFASNLKIGTTAPESSQSNGYVYHRGELITNRDVLNKALGNVHTKSDFFGSIYDHAQARAYTVYFSAGVSFPTPETINGTKMDAPVMGGTFGNAKASENKIYTAVGKLKYFINQRDVPNSLKLKAGDNITLPDGQSVKVQKRSSDSALYIEVAFTRTVKVGTPAKPAVKDNGSSTSVNAGASSIFRADANTAVNLTAVAKTNVAPSTLTGNIVATLDGKQVTASLHNSADSKNVHVYTYKKGERVNANKMTAGHYWAAFENVTVNAGASYAGKTETFTLNKGTFSSISVTTPGATNEGASLSVTADSNGVFHLGPVLVDFYAYNANDLKEVHFYDATTGNVVTSGSVNLHAVNGKLNVSAVYSALAGKYVASQLLNGQGVDQLLPLNDFRDQLKKQNIDVDPNGYFTAPASFNLTFNAKSNDNGATASLPVTVTVDNVTPTASQETTRTVKIMHIATIYDKNGKATHEPALRAYNTVSVVSDPVSLKDEKGNDAGKFYKLAGKDQYIKVGNVDGTSRSLKHNSYVYKSTGKRRGKTVLKKGSSVTTYGKSFMIAGHQMYRIGENKYVKKANF